MLTGRLRARARCGGGPVRAGDGAEVAAGLLSPARHLERHDRLRGRRRPVARGGGGRRGAAPDVASRRRRAGPRFRPTARRSRSPRRYEGPGEVYTLPLAGGVPSRLTWDASRPSWMSWTPQGEVLYATRRHSTLPNTQLVRLDPPLGRADDRPARPGVRRRVRHGGHVAVVHPPAVPGQPHAALQGRHGPEPLALHGAGRGSDAADGRLPGHQQDADAVEGPHLLRQRPRRRHEPVVDGRTRRRPHTAHETPRLRGAVALAVERPDRLPAGRRHSRLRHRRRARTRPCPITLVSDFDQLRERWVKNAIDWISSAHLSPSGDRVVLTARGQVFVAPALQGRIVEATRNKAARHRNARFMPDGKTVADACRTKAAKSNSGRSRPTASARPRS